MRKNIERLAQRETGRNLRDDNSRLTKLETAEYPTETEGIWTAVLSDASSGGNTAAITTNYATYIKIGQLVVASFRLLGISTAGMTGGNTLQLQGLPFLSQNNSNYRATGTVRVDNVAFTGYVMVIMSGNVTNASFVEHTSGAAANFIIVSDLTSGTANLTGQITYIADA